MVDARDRRIAREHLDEAAWDCQEVGIDKEEAQRIVGARYDAIERDKKGDE